MTKMGVLMQMKMGMGDRTFWFLLPKTVGGLPDRCAY